MMHATRTRFDQYVAWCFMLPALTGLLCFMVLPFCLAIILSFTNARLGTPLPIEWVGAREYLRVVQDPLLRQALWNNIVFACGVVPVQTLFALMAALLLNQPLHGRLLIRTLFFVPVVFPLSLVAVVWVLFFGPDTNGLMNSVLSMVTLGAWTPVDFLHDPDWALPAVMLTSIWQGMGFQMIILLAGLQDVSPQLLEAARLDGANAWQRLRHVVLPQLRNPLIFVIIVTTILSFRSFDQIRIMTQGGPNGHSATMVFAAVQAAFDRAQIAKGSAISVLFFILILLLTLVLSRVLRQEKA